MIFMKKLNLMFYTSVLFAMSMAMFASFVSAVEPAAEAVAETETTKTETTLAEIQKTIKKKN